MGLIRSIKRAYQRVVRGYDETISWELAFNNLKHMNDGLKEYLKEAPKEVELSYHKFKYKKKVYTQYELMLYMKDLSDKLLEYYYTDIYDGVDFLHTLDEYFEIYKALIGYMWW